MPQAKPPLARFARPSQSSLDHFRFLAKRGRDGGASGGERRAHILASAVRDHVPGLDDEAIAGLIEFIKFTQARPGTAQALIA